MTQDFTFRSGPCPLCPDMLTAPTAAGGGKPLVFVEGIGLLHWSCWQRHTRHRRIVAKVLDEARQGVMDLKGE